MVALRGSREGGGHCLGRPRGDRDRKDRRIKLVRRCEVTAIGYGICGDFGYKRTDSPPTVSGSQFLLKCCECSPILDKRPMDIAPAQVAWNGGGIIGTSTSGKSCSSLPHQLGRHGADGGRPFPFRI